MFMEEREEWGLCFLGGVTDLLRVGTFGKGRVCVLGYVREGRGLVFRLEKGFAGLGRGGVGGFRPE